MWEVLYIAETYQIASGGNTMSIVTIQKKENGRVYSNNPQTKISQIAKKPNVDGHLQRKLAGFRCPVNCRVVCLHRPSLFVQNVKEISFS